MNAKKKIVMAALLSAILLMMPLTAYAADAKVLETKAYGEDIYIFIKGISEITSETTVQIGNTVCQPEQISTAAFEKMDVYMNTIILIDNSMSIPVKSHGDIAEILNAHISGAGENERIKIGTFAEEATYLCDYTNDHNVLQGVVENIAYSNQSTYLSDVLYGTVSQIKEEKSSVCTRIIIFSDGADDNFIGYTNEEVRGYIEKNQCPVYTVGVVNNNAQALETMFSFSRAAKTEYFLLDGTVSNEDIANAFLSDRNGICLKISPDESLKDGSSKSIMLKLNTADGVVELTTNVDMPFGAGIDKNVAEPDTEPESEIKTSLPTITPANLDDNAGRNDDGKTKSGAALWIALITCAIIVAVAAIIFVLRRNAKKQMQKTQDEAEDLKKDPIQNKNEGRQNVEEIRHTIMQSELGRNTVHLFGNGASFNIILTEMDSPARTFEVPIKDGVLIGYDAVCDIQIKNDDYISGKHCTIEQRGGKFYLADAHSTNGTFLNGSRISAMTEIVSGNVIKIGDTRLKFEVK